MNETKKERTYVK